MALPLNEIQTRLETFLSQRTKAAVRISALRQLTGGASRDTWALDAEVSSGPETGKHALVLRRDMGGNIQDEALARQVEFELLQVAFEAGVLVPRPRWSCGDASVLEAPFFLMNRVEGESVGRRVVKEPALAEARRQLPYQMGEQLARIHRLTPRMILPRPEPGMTPAQAALARVSQQLRNLAEPHPVLELSLRWLQSRAPECPAVVLVHGDFRVGNLMVGSEGLRAVFDWEFAHWGDAAEDLAWPCVRSWRFGNDQLRLGGIGKPEIFWTAYRQAGGAEFDSHALGFWEILGNLRWAVGCISQANRHLSGQAVSIELASLGRRTAEMELELLSLIGKTEAKS